MAGSIDEGGWSEGCGANQGELVGPVDDVDDWSVGGGVSQGELAGSVDGGGVVVG
ncbi:MAG TPA: hypothetical protein VFI65_07610 [Streptosporangiaceae bacterium]|nr:hypothetical protein [Streptosporangiaceae bacterium]